MRVLVVYCLKTDDYGWLNDFYPARRLRAACENRSIPLRFLFPRDVPAFLERIAHNGPMDDNALADWRGAGLGDVALIRGPVDELTVDQLAAAGFACVNPSAGRRLATDKMMTARFLEARAWPTPQTALQSEAALDYPYILKPRFGSRGIGVSLIERDADLAAWREACAENREASDCAHHVGNRAGDGVGNCISDSLGEQWIAQEYVATSRGRDVRVFFAGGEILAIADRQSDGLVSNACRGGDTFSSALSLARREAVGREVLAIAREAGLWYGTVDFLFTAPRAGDIASIGDLGPTPGETTDDPFAGLTICEINSSPGFEALDQGLDLDIAAALIDRLLRDFG